MRLLPTLALAGCALTVDDSQIPERKQKDCAEELQRMEDACLQADVIGTNDNRALYEARDAVKACVSDALTVTCSDQGMSRTLSYDLPTKHRF